MIKRLEIEKKFYQNYDFDCSDRSKQESSWAFKAKLETF